MSRGGTRALTKAVPKKPKTPRFLGRYLLKDYFLQE